MEGILIVYYPPICNSIWVRPQDMRAPYHGLCNSECNDVIYVFCQNRRGNSGADSLINYIPTKCKTD